MATQPAPMPIEQYLTTSYSPDVDFIDGYLEERNFGEFDHARLQAIISAIFVTSEAAWHMIGVAEQRIRVDQTRVRICDIALLRADAPREKVTSTLPFLCLEIMSPEDRLSRAKIVLGDYLRMGVEHIWLLDPMRRVAYTFDRSGLHENEGALLISGTGIRLDVDALFARLD